MQRNSKRTGFVESSRHHPRTFVDSPALRRRRADSLEFAIFGFLRVLPSTQVQCHTHTSIAQFIRISAVRHRPRHHHSSDAQSRHCLGLPTPRPIVSTHPAPLEHSNHRAKHRLKSPPRAHTAPRHVGRQRCHRAGILYVLKVLPRKISLHHLRPHVSRR